MPGGIVREGPRLALASNGLYPVTFAVLTA
jgi:hypothetical protein